MSGSVALTRRHRGCGRVPSMLSCIAQFAGCIQMRCAALVAPTTRLRESDVVSGERDCEDNFLEIRDHASGLRRWNGNPLPAQCTHVRRGMRDAPVKIRRSFLLGRRVKRTLLSGFVPYGIIVTNEQERRKSNCARLRSTSSIAAFHHQPPPSGQQ